MRVDQLRPLPDQRTEFAWSHHVMVPAQPGCYVLANYAGEVLYVGLASVSIHDRMGIHLDTGAKRKPSAFGVPFWFYYLLTTPTQVAPTERGWMNQAILEDGSMPILSKVYSTL